ncbi:MULTISPECIES: CDP-glucose 4,6-dehydratase [Leptospira]|uniref:CDP-glucose 4,6-dehydratase n=2 Tax=Leptospira borgpetersenii TaxID=174 RepID=A0A0E3B4C7_LEPBO|nr:MULTISPECIES: CDP-glucose 4,6-dehydratase [Leptospira]ALO25996.1 CDP-glucose 4,6-dehydratase [Leptospira borgpetersenii serovar Ballum]ANH00764.1 CDP-glucose 4,6-dehydratase [Leptospira borgpetersenii str. 4E]AXX16218.1 CDP-glucose 4,6-dehydratase [Leptospira borgpetersenii serovar Ceylonica]EKQ90271.1 CDP-glucose 4,6-dehydratase [Leptospira borgpetersenii str. UI 09149]EKR00467.1 CDP-glucose 4,6-dehydratase [Leptospira borgpetersenii serovar Castellonis str. 200801910]
MFENIYKNKKILVTGHTGFKGSWLVIWLHSLGAEVAGFSLDVPTLPNHFELLSLDKKIKDYRGDVRDRSKFSNVIDEFKPEIIFHMAAQALVRKSYQDPVGTFETNVMGMVNLLDIIRTKSFVEVVVLITSDKAYRNNEWCWGYRETDVLGGHDPYSSSKSCADLIAQSYYYSFLKDTKTKIAITRAGNVIGGGDWAADRIVPDCIRAWSKNESVFIRSPLATRPWQHVLEPLSGYLLLGEKLYVGQDGLVGEAFNFGPDASIDQTVSELLNAMMKRWPGVRWEVPEGYEGGGKEAKLLKLSCDKVLFHLKWKSVLDFSETVDFTVNWYRNWVEKKENVYDFTLSQIHLYCQLASKKNYVWTH